MKRHVQIGIGMICVALLFIFADFNAIAQEEFTKDFGEIYTVDKSSQLSIDNKYGDIDIRDWNEDKVKIDAKIIIRNVSKEKADKMFGKVEISITREGEQILVKTDYSEAFFDLVGKDFQNDKIFEVKYLVMLPAYLKVDAVNKYGDLFVSNISSASVFRVDYGTLKINRIAAADRESMATVDLAYSKGMIEEAHWLRIIARYSKLTILESKALVAVTKYSKLTIEKGSSLVCDSKYDGYELGNISNFVTEAEYSNFKINDVYKKVILDTKYTDVRITNIAPEFELIDIHNSYGTIKLGIDPTASYNLSGEARYARITYPENSEVNRFQENTEMRVNGRVGKKPDPTSDVKIETSYGGVSLNE